MLGDLLRVSSVRALARTLYNVFICECVLYVWVEIGTGDII